MKRIVVIGTSGSGKTTFAAALANVLNFPHLELDAFHWSPGWVATPKEVFINKVEIATRAATWVVDGNYYSKAQHVIWPRADTLIWLSYPFGLVLGRLLWRTARRLVSREECCNGNQEDWRQAFSRDSIIIWAFQSHWRNQRRYEQDWTDSAFAHLRKLRFRSPQEAADWLKELKQ